MASNKNYSVRVCYILELTRGTHQNASLGIVESLKRSTQVNFFFQRNDDFQCHKYLSQLLISNSFQIWPIKMPFGDLWILLLSPLEHPWINYPLPCMNQEIHFKKQSPSLKGSLNVFKHSPLLNVAWIWILELKMSQWHVNSVCGNWFLSLFGEVFSGVSSWSPSTRTNNSTLHCDLGS